MKLFLTTLLSLAVASLSAQSGERITIPGTNCSVVKSADFIPAKRFTGVEHVSQHAALMLSMISSPVDSNRNSLTASTLSRLGYTFIRSEEIVLAGIKVPMAELTQMNRQVLYRKYMTIIGDASKTILITGTAPDSNQALCTEVKNMILSIGYVEEAEKNNLDYLPFTLSVDSTYLRVARMTASGAILTRDARFPTASGELITLTIGTSIRKKENGSMRELAMSRFGAIPDVDSLLSKSADTLVLDSLHGYLLRGDFINKSGVKMQAEMAMLFTPEKDYYLLAFVCRKEDTAALVRGQEILRSFRRR